MSKVKFEINEIKNEGKIIDEKNFVVYAYKLRHYNCYGYRFEEKPKRKINVGYIDKFNIPRGPILKQLQEGKDILWKGKKVKAKDATFLVKGKAAAFIFDTAYCEEAKKLAEDADIVVSEATFLTELEGMAGERDHLTAKQAAMIAKNAKAKKLYLMHISRRYAGKEELILKEAKKYFPSSFLAEDLMRVEIK